MSVGRTLLDLGLAFTQPTVRLGLKDLVTNILSLVVVLECGRFGGGSGVYLWCDGRRFGTA